MQAAEVGKALKIATGRFVVTGGTVTLLTRQPGSSTTVPLACTINADTISVTRTTTVTDFPVPGVYIIQLKVVLGGNVYYSLEMNYTVNPIIGP